MGGLAIKNAFTRRYTRDEYNKIVPEIISKAKKVFSDATDTTFFKDKESFGDADILIKIDKPITFDIKQWIYDEFKSKEVVVNSHIYSFEFNELQVDFILTPERNWETSKIYFSYNDLHNLIGKVAHKFGLKWGFDGLEYVYRVGGKVLGKFNVTKDYRKALTFLGFDATRYDTGFNNTDEIFNYVTNSKYFSPFMFDLENLNHINRTRDKKRTTYANFLIHIEPLKMLGKERYHYFYHDKKAYLGYIDFNFPGFFKTYRELEIKEETKTKIKNLFNGELIMTHFPQLTGKVLGEAILNFRNHFDTNYEYDKYILNTNDTTIIFELFKKINNL